MDFITSTIISGIVYDLIKGGIKLNFRNVFGGFYNTSSDNSIYEKFIEEINIIEDEKDKIDYCSKLLNEENQYTIMFEQSLYKTNFAKRFDYIISLINDAGWFGEKVNAEKLGKLLGFSSANDLKKYYISTEEPSYEFMEELAVKLGVNVEWMQYGQKEPFKSILPYIHRANQILIQKEFKDVKEFIFVIDNAEYRRNLGVIIRFDEIKYDYYPHTFVFHADVGADGASELFSVYNFLKELNRMGKMPLGVYKISEEQFSELFNGKVYQGSVKKYQKEWCQYLLDDFIDLYDSEEKKKQYLEWYGKVFVDCQFLIKNIISK